MTRTQFRQIRVAFAVLTAMIVAVFAHSVYVDVASCIRGNEVRRATAEQARQSAAALRARAGREPRPIAIIDLRRARQDDVIAGRRLLACTIPFPQT